jgi:hypothetical protein
LAIGIFEGITDCVGCLVGGRLRSFGWLKYRHQRSFPNQVGPVCSVVRGGVCRTSVGHSCRSRVLEMKRKMQKASFFVIPGVREQSFVDPSQEDRVKKQAKLDGGISMIAEAEEELFSVDCLSRIRTPVQGG